MEELEVRTSRRAELRDITDEVQAAVGRLRLRCGAAVVYVPHTTAGVTINENADPDVAHDLLAALERLVPWEQPFFRHAEGNSAAHVKAGLMGSSVTVPVEDGRLALGRWQAIYFCEFDGPRARTVLVQALPAPEGAVAR